MKEKDFNLNDGNVAIRPIAGGDAEFLQRIWHEPSDFEPNYIGPLAKAKKFVEKNAWNDMRKCFIVHLTQDDLTEPVGAVTAYWYDQRFGDIEVGTDIALRWRGIGIETRAKRLLIDYLFRAFPVHRVTGKTATDNEPTRRSLEKCGMQLEGVTRKQYIRNGEYVDRAHYALLREDWEGLRETWKLEGNIEPLTPSVSDDIEPEFLLVGEKVQLRPVEPEHLGFVTEVFSHRFTYLDQELVSEDGLKSDYEKDNDDPVCGACWGKKHRVFLIESHEGVPVGVVGLWNYDKRNLSVEVGTMILDEKARGKGWGTEAKLLVMDYAFKSSPVERIYAGTNQYNRAARCSLSRSGLRLTNLIAGIHEGRRSPSGAALYDITRDEWLNEREVPDA